MFQIFKCEIVQCIVTRFRILLVGIFFILFCMKSQTTFNLKVIFLLTLLPFCFLLNMISFKSLYFISSFSSVSYLIWHPFKASLKSKKDTVNKSQTISKKLTKLGIPLVKIMKTYGIDSDIQTKPQTLLVVSETAVS